jgi:hypothetical protein
VAIATTYLHITLETSNQRISQLIYQVFEFGDEATMKHDYRLVKFGTTFCVAIGLLFGLGTNKAFASCIFFASYGNLPSLRDNPAIFAGKVLSIENPTAEEQNRMSYLIRQRMVVDVKETWNGKSQKTSGVVIPGRSSNSCDFELPFGNFYPPDQLSRFSSYFQKDKDYIFLSYSNDLGKVDFRDSILLEQSQAVFAGLEIKPSSHSQKLPIDGIPLTCSLDGIDRVKMSDTSRDSELFWLAYSYAVRGDRQVTAQIAQNISSIGLRANLLLALTSRKPELKAYEEALKMLDDTEPSKVLLETMVRRLAESNQLEEATQIARKLKDRTNPFTFIAKKYVEAEKYDRALMLVSETSDEPSKGFIAFSIVEAYLKQNKLDLALQVASKIESKGFQSSALFAIAKKLSETGNYEKAIQIANSVDLPSRNQMYGYDSKYPAQGKPEAFYQIAELAAKSGDFDLAIKIAESTSKDTKAAIFTAISIQHFRLGNKAQGIKFFKLSIEATEVQYRQNIVQRFIDARIFKQIALYIQDLPNQDILLFSEAEQAIKKGDIDYAYQIIDRINKKEYKDSLLNQFAIQVANQGQYDRALKLLRTIQGDAIPYASNSLLVIASNYAKQGKREKLPTLLRESIRLAKASPNRSNSLKNIAFQAIEFNLHNLVLEIVNEIKPTGSEIRAQIWAKIEKARTLNELAIKYAQLGDDRRALQLLALSKSSVIDVPDNGDWFEVERRDSPNSLIAMITRRLMSENKLERALEIVRDMTDTYELEYIGSGYLPASTKDMEKSILISEIAIQLGSVGKFEKAEEAASRINHVQTRDRTWKELSLQRSQMKQYDNAISNSRKITDFSTKTYLERLFRCAKESVK